MKVFDKDNNLIAEGLHIERVNAQNEIDLIKVVTTDEGDFYYIGHNERDTYTIK